MQRYWHCVIESFAAEVRVYIIMVTATDQAVWPNDVGLSENDLKDLCEALHPVGVKYHAFGLQIDLHSSEIECIKADYKYVHDCLREVLNIRLRKTPPLTWNDIARALKSQTVGEPRLAREILMKYGKRPVPSAIDEQPEPKKCLSSSSESDDSDYERSLSEVERKKLRKVFRRSFGKLCCAIKNPVEITTHLQMKGLLTRTVMCKLLTSPDSQQTKAITLVTALERRIKSHPGRIFTIVEEFLCNENLKEVAGEMLIETGEWLYHNIERVTEYIAKFCC